MENTEEDIVLDVCGLEPPEPLERILDALADLAIGARLRVLIDREPHPLYGILRNNGYDYSFSAGHHPYELLIWRKS